MDPAQATAASGSGLIELSDWIGALRMQLETAQAEGAGKSLQFVVGPVELEFELTATREGKGTAGSAFGSWTWAPAGAARLARRSA